LAKFLGHTVTFLVFLLLLIISSMESVRRVSNTITLGTRFPQIQHDYIEYR
jgi:hypothetical protein